MPVYLHRSVLPVSAEVAYAWHTRPGALERLFPPWERIRLLEGAAGVEQGRRKVFAVGKGPFTFRMEGVHGPPEPGRSFSEEQVRGPFSRWRHEHRFLPEGQEACVLEDEVEWRLPMGLVGRIAGGRSAYRSISRMFLHRHERVYNDLVRHSRFAGQPPLRVAVSGASGLVGTRLCHFLASGGHSVVRLVRPPTTAAGGEGAVAVWHPAAGEIDAEALEGLDAVVHLSGESLASGRWNARRRAAILESRIVSTTLLARTIAGLKEKPRVMVCASAIGWYGDTGEEAVDEVEPAGEGFLADVCKAWEAAPQPAREAGIRVVNLRTGMVLAGEGGALARLALPFRLGLGGRLGSGSQFISWVALEDLLGVVQTALYDQRLDGPVNAVSPWPVTNNDFTRILGKVMRRPTLAPLPAQAVGLLLGEMGRTLLLASQRVLPTRLEQVEFQFLYPQLEAALRSELGLWPPS